MKKILIIEDDPAIVLGLTTSFEAEHFEVLTAQDGEKGFRLSTSEQVDLIILDLQLPKKNGLEICRELRAKGISTPILMLTSRVEEMDKVLGLEIGADDYMTKPFSLRELHARVKALLRRHTPQYAAIEEGSFGNVYLDFKKMEARKDNIALKLSAKEFDVLKYFLMHEGEVITRDMLLDEVWGYENFPSTRTVDNYILTLRKKIEDDPSFPKHIQTIHTAGYKFVK